MGSILSFLSPALTTATQAAGAYQGAEAQAGIQQRQQAVQAIMLMKQAHEQEIQDALAKSRTGYYNQRADSLANPPVQHHYTLVPSEGPDGKPVYAKVDTNTGEIAPTETPLKPPTAPKEPTPHFTITPITDPTTGQVHLARVNTLTGEVQDTGTLGKQPAPKTTGGLAGMTDARIKIAESQAANADQIMTQFESKILSGGAPIPTAGIILAKRALEPDAMGSSAAEAILNTQYPDLAQYVRAAKQVATAERLVSPRGGSNALTQAEAALSAGGAHANNAQIQQAQQFRRALISGLQGHGGAQSPPPASTPGAASTPPAANGNPFADLIPSGHNE